MISRRQWLAAAVGSVFTRQAFDSVERRVATLIAEFEAQGFHRTATNVDRLSGEWLAEQVRRAGLNPVLEPFSLSRVDLVTSTVVVNNRRIDGIPLFDGAFTEQNGVRGKLGLPDSNADIMLSETAVNQAGAGALGTLRREGRHKAIVAITRGRRPGLCPSNADSFTAPFGPPVLQVSSEESAFLTEQARRGADAHVTAHVTRNKATAVNVTATRQGSDLSLPPLVVMTPRSGWYWCASERGGGIACWLEVMRALKSSPPKRTLMFVASSGHELGHLGINAFIDKRPGIVKQAVAGMHFGANIGAGTDPTNTLQASDDELDAMLTKVLTANGLTVDRRARRGAVPGGEAEAVHRGGGRYVSIIGGNELFHNLEDRGPKAVNPVSIAKFAAAFSEIAALT
jgi:hypothetical protein